MENVTGPARQARNDLFMVPVRVRPGPGCEMPRHLVGALVPCYVGAPDHLAALAAVADRLRGDGYVFEDVVGGRMDQLDPLKWNAYVASTWQEYADHFPSQEDMLRLVDSGGVFLGPFLSWEQEPQDERSGRRSE